MTYLSSLAIVTVCHEALVIVLLLQSRQSSSRKVLSHELQLSANVRLVWLWCLSSFSSSRHIMGKVEAHSQRCFRDTRKALLGKGSLITSQPF